MTLLLIGPRFARGLRRVRHALSSRQPSFRLQAPSSPAVTRLVLSRRFLCPKQRTTRWLFACAGLVMMSACQTTATNLTLKPAQLQAVQTDLKRQLGVYLAERETRTPPSGTLDCGNGKIDFMVTTVTLDLKTTIDWTGGVGGKGTVGSPISVLLPTATGTHENNQHLTFTQTLIPPALQDAALFDKANVALLESKPSAIADAIFALRDGLVTAAMRAPDGPRLPCMTVVASDPKNEGGTFIIGINVSSDFSGSITLGALNWGPEYERKSENDNTLTVSFVPVLTEPPAAPPAAGPAPGHAGPAAHGPIATHAKAAACVVKPEDINKYTLCQSRTKHDVTFCDTCQHEIDPRVIIGGAAVMGVMPQQYLNILPNKQ
jgi:hypothetical protein